MNPLLSWLLIVSVLLIVLFFVSESFPAFRAILFMAGILTMLVLAAVYMGTNYKGPALIDPNTGLAVEKKRQAPPVVGKDQPRQVVYNIVTPKTPAKPQSVAQAKTIPPTTVPAAAKITKTITSRPAAYAAVMPKKAEPPPDPYLNPVDAELAPEEKKAYQIALGRANQLKPPGAEAARRAALSGMYNRVDAYNRAQAGNMRATAAHESARNSAINTFNNGIRSWDERGFYARQAAAHGAAAARAHAAFEATQRNRAANEQALAARNRVIAKEDDCLRAQAIQDVHEQFGQYTKATIARRIADKACAAE